CGNLRTVIFAVAMALGGDRIVEPFFDLIGAYVIGHDGACIALIAALGEIGHDIGAADGLYRLQGQQFRITRAGANSIENTGHRPGLAKALRQAEVMALPPRRPRTMAKGTP